MGQLAEENRAGTIEFLLTKPIKDVHVIVGKFLATLILICIALLMTIPYYITVANIGPVDHGAVISGYIGLILMSAAYISIGIFASSISNNQIVGFLLAIFVGILFHWIFGMVAGGISGFFGEVLNFLSTRAHFESIARGVLDTTDLVFFISIVVLGLASTETILARKHQ